MSALALCLRKTCTCENCLKAEYRGIIMNIKILLGQMEVIPGRPDLNFAKAMKLVQEAHSAKADMLLLPEMCIPGYLIGDIWEQESFIEDCQYYNEQLIKASKETIICFGSIAEEKHLRNEDGSSRKYNAAFICKNGGTIGGYAGRRFVIKNNLPNYREFDDSRHFFSLEKLAIEENCSVKDLVQPIEVVIKDRKLNLGLLICEDSWNENYHNNLAKILSDKGAQLLCNLSCSPFTLGKNQKRMELFGQQAKNCNAPLLYCNNVGVQNNGKNIFTFDGCSAAYNQDGTPATAAEAFSDTLLEVELNLDSLAIASCKLPAESEEIPAIYKALHYGTEKFLAQCGIKKMTIGLSGGIDSAVTAAMYADILGAENILLLNLPSKFNSATTQNLAQKLAQALGANYASIGITQSFEHTLDQLENTPITCYSSNTNFNLSINQLGRENIQARDRGARIIAAAAAAFGGAFSCNSNKAEISIGYATFYGDICGALAMIGDLWKHQVYALGRYLNDDVFQREVIPKDIFNIRPSAELSDAQTVGNGGDPLIYEYHDYLFRAFIENRKKLTPADILKLYKNGNLAAFIGCDEKAISNSFPTAQAFIEDLERWWRLFSGFSVAKRIQAPPLIAISRRAFGGDHREAQLSPYFSREYYTLKDELTK